MITADTFSARARWLFPVVGPPIENGVLHVREGRIESLETDCGGGRSGLQDWGCVAVTPGWINAHTHLEFSDCAAPLCPPGVAFADWIRRLVAWRRRRDADPASGAAAKQAAVRHGLQQLVTGGVTNVAEIATWPWPRRPLKETSLQGAVCLELIGLAASQEERLLGMLQQHLGDAPGPGWRAAVSPHAPYTVGLSLLEQVCRRCGDAAGLVVMHLAETVEELELLASAAGPLRALLEDFDAWDAAAAFGRVSPWTYLERLALANRSLVVHGNYLNDTELTFLGERADRMSVIYCPRTHAYFEHAAYPHRRMLRAGVNVALGTDSRASNPDLSMLEEMRAAAALCGAAPRQVLEMATRNGARALGLSSAGCLRTGYRADLTVVSIPDRACDDPHELLLADESRVERVFIGGRSAHDAGGRVA